MLALHRESGSDPTTRLKPSYEVRDIVPILALAAFGVVARVREPVGEACERLSEREGTSDNVHSVTLSV
jgi:hypothetical protein